MILALDPGIATCGWAVVRPGTGQVHDLGVIRTKPSLRVARSTDRARRIRCQVQRFQEIALEHPLTAIAAEAMSFHGPRVQAVVSQTLSWGAIIAFAEERGLDLLEVGVKAWQHAILPEAVSAIDYQVLERKLAEFTAGQVGERLLAIPATKRTHALDAVGVGVFAALSTATRVSLSVEASA